MPYPIDPLTTLHNARRRFANELEVHRAAIRKRLAQIRKLRLTQSARETQTRKPRLARAPVHYRPPLESNTIPRYGWDDETKRLYILFVHSRIAKWHDDFQLRWTLAGPTVPRTGSPIRPPYDSARVNLSFGVEMAALYIYDATGTLRDVRIGATRSLPRRFISARSGALQNGLALFDQPHKVAKVRSAPGPDRVM